MRTSLGFLGIAVLAVSSAGLAFHPNYEAAADPSASECSPANAERWDVNALAQDSPLLIGRCVTISGFALGWHVYASPEDMYRHDQAEADRILEARQGWFIREGSPYQVGIERHELEAAELGPWAYEVTVTGQVTDCDSRSEAGWRSSFANEVSRSDNLTIVLVNPGGYCHYNSGAVILPIAIEYGDRRTFPRKMGTAARERFGSIRPIPDESSFAEELRTLGIAAHSAIRSGDREALAALSGEAESYWIEGFFEVERAYLDRVHEQESAPQLALFELGLPQHFPDFASNNQRSEGYICYCKEADCSERWPISIKDTLVDSRRPYVCLYRNGSVGDDGMLLFELTASIPDVIGYVSPFEEADQLARR